jgi:hypothetical protein
MLSNTTTNNLSTNNNSTKRKTLMRSPGTRTKMTRTPTLQVRPGGMSDEAGTRRSNSISMRLSMDSFFFFATCSYCDFLGLAFVPHRLTYAVPF